jgi:hypothetical protein
VLCVKVFISVYVVAKPLALADIGNNYESMMHK